jgi:hypothetical protein
MDPASGQAVYSHLRLGACDGLTVGSLPELQL